MGMPLQRLSLDEYLAWEETQAGRNEFWRGEVIALAGANRGHGRIVASMAVGPPQAPCKVGSMIEWPMPSSCSRLRR